MNEKTVNPSMKEIEDVIDYYYSYGIRNIPRLMYDRIDIFYLPVERLRQIFSYYNFFSYCKDSEKRPNRQCVFL